MFSLDIRLPSLEISNVLSGKIISSPDVEWGRGSDQINFKEIMGQYRGVNSGLVVTGVSAVSLDLSRFADGGRGERRYWRSEPIVCEGESPKSSKRKCVPSKGVALPGVLARMESGPEIGDESGPLPGQDFRIGDHQIFGDFARGAKIRIPCPMGSVNVDERALIQVKIFVPQLNVLYNYGMLRVRESLSAECVCNKVAMFINHDRFYLFQETFGAKNSYSEELVSGLRLLPLISDHSALSAYWPMVLRTLTNRLNMSYVRENKVVNSGTGDLGGEEAEGRIGVGFRLKTGIIESLIVVPSVVSLNAALGDIKIAPVCVRGEAGSERMFDSKSTNKGGKGSVEKKEDVLRRCSVSEISKREGKRSDPGYTEGEEGVHMGGKAMKKVKLGDENAWTELDSVREKENIKTMKTDACEQNKSELANSEGEANEIEMGRPMNENEKQEGGRDIRVTPSRVVPLEVSEEQYPPTPVKPTVTSADCEAVEASKALKTSLLYLDLCVLFSFLELYSKFSNLKYIKTTVDQSSVERNLMISKEWSNEKIFETIYGKIYQEQQFFGELSDGDSRFLLNGHFYYGNCEEDPGICSVVNSLHPALSKPKVAFENMTCKDSCFGCFGDMGNVVCRIGYG